jgi:DNA polymerase II small subunit
MNDVSSQEIMGKFSKNSLLPESSVFPLLQDKENIDDFIKYLKEKNITFVTEELVNEYYFPSIFRRESFEFSKEKLPLDRFVEEREREKVEEEIRIFSIDEKNGTDGTIEDFLGYFMDRYERISKIFRHKMNMRDATPLGFLRKRHQREEVKFVGLVTEKSTTKNGNIILTLEDPTDRLKVLLGKNNERLQEKAKRIVEDEVLGVEGTIGEGIVFANDVDFPDIPIGRTISYAKEEVACALISDTHIGSNVFQEKNFLRFIRWLALKSGTEQQRKLASSVHYLIIVGDVVDGVGVYPGQEKELSIFDIREQYVKAAELLSMVPREIKIFICPGNHDASRIAEPQLPISKKYAQPLYDMENVIMVGSPSILELHGVKILLYHGNSLIDMAQKMGINPADSTSTMMELLKKRHLAPCYGTIPITPQTHDPLIIEDVPDLFVTGHTHVNGYKTYRGTTIVNSGCWQSQSEYQKTRNIFPTPAQVPIFNLATHDTTIMKFGE